MCLLSLFIFVYILLPRCKQKCIINTWNSFWRGFYINYCQKDTNVVEIVSKLGNEILEDKLQNIGNAIGPNESCLQIILVKSVFGFHHSPHGKGKIYIVKNKKIMGYYNNLMYNFNAYLNNGILMIQPEEDCPFTKIDFSKEIPSSIFLLEDSSRGGNTYPFYKE